MPLNFTGTDKQIKSATCNAFIYLPPSQSPPQTCIKTLNNASKTPQNQIYNIIKAPAKAKTPAPTDIPIFPLPE